MTSTFFFSESADAVQILASEKTRNSPPSWTKSPNSSVATRSTFTESSLSVRSLDREVQHQLQPSQQRTWEELQQQVLNTFTCHSFDNTPPTLSLSGIPGIAATQSEPVPPIPSLPPALERQRPLPSHQDIESDSESYLRYRPSSFDTPASQDWQVDIDDFVGQPQTPPPADTSEETVEALGFEVELPINFLITTPGESAESDASSLSQTSSNSLTTNSRDAMDPYLAEDENDAIEQHQWNWETSTTSTNALNQYPTPCGPLWPSEAPKTGQSRHQSRLSDQTLVTVKPSALNELFCFVSGMQVYDLDDSNLGP